MLTFLAGSRITALGSSPRLIFSMSWKNWRRIISTPRSLPVRFSSRRSATTPCPTQATKSWFITWVDSQRPCSSLIGPYQWGTFSCSYGSLSCGTREKDQQTLSVFSSSIGTRHSKWSPRKTPLGHRQTRPTFHRSCSSSVSSRTRL
ncbi:hypothetical protein D3C80_1296510 [compost metagenome]